MDFNPVDLIAGGVIVIFLVQQLKRWVPKDFLPIAAIVVGVVVQLVNDWALAVEPLARGDWWMTVVTGIGVGMLAAGTYDIAGRIGKVDVPPAEIVLEAAPWDVLENQTVFDPATLDVGAQRSCCGDEDPGN